MYFNTNTKKGKVYINDGSEVIADYEFTITEETITSMRMTMDTAGGGARANYIRNISVVPLGTFKNGEKLADFSDGTSTATSFSSGGITFTKSGDTEPIIINNGVESYLNFSSSSTASVERKITCTPSEPWTAGTIAFRFSVRTTVSTNVKTLEFYGSDNTKKLYLQFGAGINFNLSGTSYTKSDHTDGN